MGLTDKQREKLGRTDAHQYYKPGPGPFWAGAGLGLLTTAGLVTTTAPVSLVALGGAVATGVSGPKAARLVASNPQPQLLQDAAYHKGYVREARGKRLGQTMLGWGSATLASLAVLVYIVLSSLTHL